ncbi:MAG TPA: RNA polymerase sigma factor [Candidatus Binataceae bacterium]|nr:RNA polymerase sigma factor [Candidatus Binataceae bacterium]
MAEPSDQDLVTRALDGEAAAFSELAGRHRGRVERLCQRFFADSELVRDIAQEAFIHAYAGLKGYRAEIPFGAWLRAIVVNLCYDELRRRRRRPEELVSDFTAPEMSWIGLVNTATPEEIVEAAEERREAKQLAERLLATLKPEDRLVLTLQNGEEMSVSEIAEIVGWSEAKVKIRAFRARQALRRQAAHLVPTRQAEQK